MFYSLTVFVMTSPSGGERRGKIKCHLWGNSREKRKILKTIICCVCRMYIVLSCRKNTNANHANGGIEQYRTIQHTKKNTRERSIHTVAKENERETIEILSDRWQIELFASKKIPISTDRSNSDSIWWLKLFSFDSHQINHKIHSYSWT